MASNVISLLDVVLPAAERWFVDTLTEALPLVKDPHLAWHGSEEVEHRMVAHDVAVYFHDSYVDRIRAMTMSVVMILVFFQRAAWYLVKTDPATDIGWWKFNRLRLRDSKLGLLPKYRKLFGSNTAMYVMPGFSQEEMGSTAQAVAYLASSPRPAPRTFDGLLRPLPAGTARWLRRTRHDVVLGVADAALAGLWAVGRDPADGVASRSRPHHRADRRGPSPRRASPGRHRADAGRRTPATLASRRTHRHSPAQRTRAAVLAVRGSASRERPRVHI